MERSFGRQVEQRGDLAHVIGNGRIVPVAGGVTRQAGRESDDARTCLAGRLRFGSLIHEQRGQTPFFGQGALQIGQLDVEHAELGGAGAQLGIGRLHRLKT